MELVGTLVILLLVITGYWSLVILPKQQSFKKHQKYVADIAPGEMVITYGGIIGTVVRVEAEVGEVVVRIAEGVEVRMITAAINQPYNPVELTKNAQIGLSDDA